jgi:hypothetical protein
MATKLNYSSFDFETLKTDFLNQLATDGVFKDYNFAGSNINQVIELFSGLGDLLNYYLNMTANESFLRTADLYENINKIVELIGYNPGGPKSSVVTVSLSASFTSPLDDDYFIVPLDNTVTASSTTVDGQAIKYSPVSQLTYVSVSGNNIFSSEITLVQGEYNTENFSGTGTSFQKFEISEPQAIEEYMIVKVNGVPWVYVENIYNTTETKVFTTRYNKNKLVEIQFGNTTYGSIPPIGTDNIEVQYIKTLDIQGAVGSFELTSFDNDIYLVDITTGSEITSTPITITITQSDASVGHSLPLTEEEIRNYAPKSYRTQDRVVTKQDHEDLLLAELNAYIKQVITLNQDEYYELNPEAIVPEISGFNYNNVYLYILPKYGFTINSNLRARIFEFLDTHKMLTINYVIENLNYVYVNVTINYKRLKTTIRTLSEIQNDFNSIIREYFSKNVQRVGNEVKYSTLLSSLNAVDGVSSLTMSLCADIPELSGAPLYENIVLDATQFALINTISANWIEDSN